MLTNKVLIASLCLLLFGICFLPMASRCIAGPVNLFHDPGTTKQFTFVPNGNAITISGTGDDTIDDPSLSTSWSGFARNDSIGGNTHIQAQWDLAFAKPVSLSSITENLYIWSDDTGSTDRLRDGHFTAWYRDTPGGPLIQMFSRSYGPDGGDGMSQLLLNETDPLAIPSAVEVVVEGWAQAFANNGHTNGTADSYVQLTDIQLMGQSVPEPGSAVLAAMGLLGWIGIRVRRRR